MTEIPIHPKISDYARETKVNPLGLVFGGGEEFELVFAISPDDEQQLIQEAQKQNLVLKRIGKFTDEFKGVKNQDNQYKEYDLPSKGFEHFS